MMGFYSSEAFPVTSSFEEITYQVACSVSDFYYSETKDED